MPKSALRLGTVLACLLIQPAQAQTAEQFSKWWQTFAGSAAGQQATGLSQNEIAKGLREALRVGTTQAVQRLGQEDGFWGDENLRIPLPGAIAQGAQTLRQFGGAQLLDQFQLTLNRAAEQAVPATAEILGNAVANLTLSDANAILTGTDDAATQYFRKTSAEEIYTRILPIVANATAQAGVTSSYKRLNQQSGGFMQLLMPDAQDLDGYVTSQAMNGLFTAIAAEEERIRENPAARSSEILRKVFSK